MLTPAERRFARLLALLQHAESEVARAYRYLCDQAQTAAKFPDQPILNPVDVRPALARRNRMARYVRAYATMHGLSLGGDDEPDS
jgi:hypothetical protein